MYYDGTICWKSYKPATMAIQAGLTGEFGEAGGA